MIYIEKYFYENDYNLHDFFTKFEAGVHYDPSWPIVFVSSSRLEHTSHEAVMGDFLGGKKRSKPSLCMAGGPESVHAEIAKILGMRGMTFSVLSACTSSAYGLYQAALLSEATGTPAIVACADLFAPIDMHWFSSLGAVSPETGIPFDKNSKGFRPSKAQAFFVVSAKPIYPVACVETMRFMTQPNEKTAIGSLDEIKQMFDDIDMSTIGWWNAHSPGTPLGDATEFKLFDSFGIDIPISSLKGRYGHALASSYLLELGAALDSVRDGFVPANERLVDRIVDDQRIIKYDVEMNKERFIKFNMGFGGKNVLSVVKTLV
jgi:3-oxoacyl-(acyl-carrier-protein) synthase